MNFDFNRITKQIEAEAEVTKNFTITKMYSFLLNELVYGNELIADKYMIDYYGLSEQKLSALKKEKNRKAILSQKLQSGLRAF